MYGPPPDCTEKTGDMAFVGVLRSDIVVYRFNRCTASVAPLPSVPKVAGAFDVLHVNALTHREKACDKSPILQA
jgi:hypothetical protein